MSKRVVISFAGIFLFLLLFNSLTPMYFGDDYVYSFIWEGHSLYEPLSENAKRISSWKDLFDSQWLHYFTWSGRTVNHTLAQFFLWKGKTVFNICNALAGTLLVAEIYWCIYKGEITKKFSAGILCWFMFLLWSFTPAFGNVFLWIDGSCNYLWPIVLLTGFSIPYIKKYYSFSEKKNNNCFFCLAMYVFGLFAGWTNENSVCWIILVLLLFMVTHRKNTGIEKWMYCGLVGLVTGYVLLMFAPGNLARLYAEQNGYNWLTGEIIKKQFSMLAFILLYFQLFLWYFSLRSLFCLRKRSRKNTDLEKEVAFVKMLCIVAFGMTAIMVFSPGFPPRSGFPGTVCLIIATGILQRVQDEYGIVLIQNKAKKFLIYMSFIYFIMTGFVAFNHYYAIHSYNEKIITAAKEMKAKDPVLTIKPYRALTLEEHVMSAYHVTDMGISEDENEWKNVAFARYYGIKGVRAMKNTGDNETQKGDGN